MENRANNLLVGTLIVVLLFSSLGFIAWISKYQSSSDFKLYYIYFSSAGGLKEGSFVRYRGVNVGEVKNVEIDPENIERVRISVSVLKTVPIKEDALATVELQSITGGTLIDISGGTQNSADLVAIEGKNYPVIPSAPSEIEELAERAPELMNDLIEVVNRINQVFDEENRNKFDQILKNLDTITQAAADEKHGLPTLIKNISLFSDDLPNIGKEFSSAMKRFDDSMKHISDASEVFDQILRENRYAISDFANFGLAEFTRSMAELRIFVENLSGTLLELDKDPAFFLFGNTKQGYPLNE